MTDKFLSGWERLKVELPNMCTNVRHIRRLKLSRTTQRPEVTRSISTYASISHDITQNSIGWRTTQRRTGAAFILLDISGRGLPTNVNENWRAHIDLSSLFYAGDRK